MSKITRSVLFALILILAGCNRPEPQPEGIPTETAALPAPTETLPQSTETLFPTEGEPTATEAIQEPAPATEEVATLPEGNPIPLLSAGTEITIHEVQMINAQYGWALTQDASGRDHILRTANGGLAWRDITPPQPFDPSRSRFPAGVIFSDPNTGWAVYEGSNLIWSTRDGGITWKPSQLEFETMGGSLLTSLDPNHVWLFQFLDAGMQKVYTAVYSSQDGGTSWTKLLDPYTDSSIQGFDKTGAIFINPQYGWLTRDFRGVAVYLYLDITSDGGKTWQNLEMPAPPTDPDAFSTCACGLYDPYLESTTKGSARLSCVCYLGEVRIVKDFLYRTSDGGTNWKIQSMPEGELNFISGQTYYTAGREIYRTSDGGVNWDLRKSVNWDGQFSFIDLNTALAVAYDPADEEYALVKTSDGCSSFEIIVPELLASQTQR